MSDLKKPLFLVPVLIAVAATSEEEARDIASGALEHMLEVSNEDRTITNVEIYPAHATNSLIEVDPDAGDLLPSHAASPLCAMEDLETGLVHTVVPPLTFDLPSRADIEAYCCPASIEGGILHFESGSTIDLGELIEQRNDLYHAGAAGLAVIETNLPTSLFAPRERLRAALAAVTTR